MYQNVLERIVNEPAAQKLGVELLLLARNPQSATQIVPQALRAIRQTAEAGTVALVRLSAKGSETLASRGAKISPPEELVREVLDRHAATRSEAWVAAPLDDRKGDRVLCLKGEAGVSLVDGFAAVLGAAVDAGAERTAHARRIRRLEAILEIAGNWGRANQMEPLLVEMAEASTRLLKAQRASIFLWDRTHKQLVARPALGVEAGELRIPDNIGVVGEVVHSGDARRIDAGSGEGRIDRSVDEKLGFHTETLLCVPLVGRNGELFGAFEVLNKIDGNFTPEDETALAELATHAAIALENTQHLEDLLATRQQLVDQAADEIRLVGDSPPIQALRTTVERVADTDLAVLVLGENGTGKEVVSRAIHYLSARRDRPFIPVNCAALTETLLESELFGHEKGAFTDAHESRAGKFELASGGTLFLDEIGDLSLGGQAKLLRVLEEKIVVRVGGSTPIHTDARVLAATNQNLAEMVRAKRFREDLYYRLNVVSLELPPLRDRGDDIMVLGEHFLQVFCRDSGRRSPKFSAAARKRLLGHTWPGNVRELRNLMERMAYLLPADQQKIDADDLAFILAPGDDRPPLVDSGLELTEATRRFQSEYIKAAITRARGNMSEAADRLGLHRSNLYRKMRHLDLPVREEE